MLVQAVYNTYIKSLPYSRRNILVGRQWIIISLKEWVSPLQALWSITWHFQKKTIVDLGTGEACVRLCYGMVKSSGYFTFLCQVSFYYFWTSSTYCLFMEEYMHICSCWDTFVYSFFLIPLVCILYIWCNGYRHRKWTRQHKFKSWTRLIAFHIALIPLEKVWILIILPTAMGK